VSFRKSLFLVVAMKRQHRRRIKRSWDKISCFSYCTDKVTIDDLSNTAVEVLLKVSEDLLLRYNLDMFQRWRLFPVVVVDGFFLQGLYFNVELASDEWLDEYFGDSDDDFSL
jgi:glutaredoxin-related protein